MVIMNSIDEKDRNSAPPLGNNTNQYVYLVDNKEEMMLILKRDLKDGVNYSTNESEPVKEFISEKVRGLLERIASNSPLSTREMEVLNYAAMGKSNKQIAEIIGLSESTIKNHFSSTLRKLRATDRTHAVTLAICNGWLDTKSISGKLFQEQTSVCNASGY
jgi:DNA-binding CsgD family transcriptional regulator